MDCVLQSIERRDGHPANPDEIFLCDGASAGVHLVMRAFIRGEQEAVLTPIPQYPLYSATLALNGGSLVPYYLDESKGWQMDIEHLTKQTAQVSTWQIYHFKLMPAKTRRMILHTHAL